MPRMPIIAGNWKMNTTIEEAVALARAVRRSLNDLSDVEVVLCPPFISLAVVRTALDGSAIRLGAQNAHDQEKGAFTGEIAPTMLVGLCDYVILGHSERRHIFGESDEFIARKVAAALKLGLKPILCVGERLEERQAGQTEAVLLRQLRSALSGIAAPDGLVIAYEPVWAIGTGIPASGPQANEAIALIRRELAALFGPEHADAIRIQYGGSVTADNIAEFLREPEIDGALVGGASLRADEFVRIVRQAAEIKGKSP